MPHILISKNHKIVSGSFKKNNFEFLYEASSTLSNKKRIYVKNSNKKFLLTKVNKSNNILIKTDKTSRIAPISIIKDAIGHYAKEINAQILFSNITNNIKKIQPKQKFLKNTEYFLKDFKYEKQIWIEIGFGSGRHIMKQAKLNPNKQFIGIEVHYPSIEKVLVQVKLENINNILIVKYDARLFMEFLKSNSVEKIFVHFPVPWDKKPHKRIYSNKFIQEALRVMQIDGSLQLRTDSKLYYEYCLKLLQNYSNIEIEKNKQALLSSKYEDRWKKQGKDIYNIEIIAKENNIPKILNYDFNFYGKINLMQLNESICKMPIVEKDYFIHFKDIFISNDSNNNGFIFLSFGNFNTPVNQYLHVQNNNVEYFQEKPLPTSSNNNAHKKIIKILGLEK